MSVDRRVLTVTVVTLSAVLTGCKFGRLTTGYLNHVDRYNDRKWVALDRWYHPRTDLTRAGKDDWCRDVHPRVAKKTCQTREGAQNVPQPTFTIYPQMSASVLDGPDGYEPSGDEASVMVPPSP